MSARAGEDLVGRRVLVLLGRTSLMALMNALATAVVARLAGADVLGTIGYLIGVVGMLSVASELGYSQAYVRSIAGLDGFARHTGTFALVKMILSLALVLAVLIAPAASQVLSSSVGTSPAYRGSYYLIGVFYFSNILSMIFQRTFAARLEAVKLALVGLGSTFLSVAAQVVTVWQGWGLTALSGAVALQGVSAFVIGLFLFRGYRVGWPSLTVLREYTIYAWPQMALIITTHLATSLDRTLLGTLGGAAQVGYYVGVFGVLSMGKEVSRAAMVLFFPRVSRDVGCDDLGSMRLRVKGAQKYLLMVVVPLVALIIVLREPFVHLYLGDRFAPSTPIVAIFALSLIPSTLSRPYRNVIYAVGRLHYLLVSRVLGLAILAVACGVLIPNSLFGLPAAGLGAMGAAVGVLLSEVVECAYVAYASSRSARVGVWRGVVWFLLAGSLMVIVGTGVASRFPQFGLLRWSSAAILGLGCYLLLLFVVGQFRRTELSLLLEAVHPIKLLRYIRLELGTVGQEIAAGSTEGTKAVGERARSGAPSPVEGAGKTG